MECICVNMYDETLNKFIAKKIFLENKKWIKCEDTDESSDMYLSPGFIDSHAHVYNGATDLGVDADRIGLSTGVHLVVDAGSAGSITFPCFKDYVIPTYKTSVISFLNISKIGLVTKKPYFDPRNIDIIAAKKTLETNKDLLIGIKVLASGLVLEDAGMDPVIKAVDLAHEVECPVMVHMSEGPPENEQVMSLLKKGDIITHCFHGKPNLKAYRASVKNADFDDKYCCIDNIMWNEDGSPIKPLKEALDRGVFLDVGHGAASFDPVVTKSVIDSGFRNFSISTDAHVRNIETIVHSLPFIMSKFLSLGMELENVVASVTSIPSKQLRLNEWCKDIKMRGTLFTVKELKVDEFISFGSEENDFLIKKIIEPMGCFIGGEYVDNFNNTI